MVPEMYLSCDINDSPSPPHADCKAAERRRPAMPAADRSMGPKRPNLRHPECREADELAAAHKRIAQLEAELALTRDACELFDEQAVVPPKRRRAITEGLIARGHSA